MTGATATGDGREPCSARRSWVPRTVAAFFLGAGVYAGIAVGTDAIARADEAATSATQVQQVPAEESSTTASTGDGTAAADVPAESPPADPSTTTGTSTTGAAADPATATPTATAPEQATDPAASTPDGAAATTAPQTATTSTTSTTGGTATVTTTTLTKVSGETVTVTARTTAPADPAIAAPTGPSAAPLADGGASTGSAVVSQAQGDLCESAGASRQSDGGSAEYRSPATASAAPGDVIPAGDAAGTAAPALTAPAAPASDGGPFVPETPLEVPAPSASFGLAGCGGPGAGEGSPKGTSAPAAAGVLGASLEIAPAVDDAAPAAPEAGSPTLTANDPATAPD